jgi:hypothetical protein
MYRASRVSFANAIDPEYPVTPLRLSACWQPNADNNPSTASDVFGRFHV